MSTPLRIVERVDSQSGYDYAPGDMWLCESLGSTHEVEGREACWAVRLPGRGYVWHTNERSANDNFWTVTGDPPNITVTPSINVGPEIWHGWITNGELSPDTDSAGCTEGET